MDSYRNQYIITLSKFKYLNFDNIESKAPKYAGHVL